MKNINVKQKWKGGNGRQKLEEKRWKVTQSWKSAPSGKNLQLSEFYFGSFQSADNLVDGLTKAAEEASHHCIAPSMSSIESNFGEQYHPTTLFI